MTILEGVAMTEELGARSRRGVYGISVMAELSGVGPQTLRLYERRGLLNRWGYPKVQRSGSGHIGPDHRAARRRRQPQRCSIDSLTRSRKLNSGGAGCPVERIRRRSRMITASPRVAVSGSPGSR